MARDQALRRPRGCAPAAALALLSLAAPRASAAPAPFLTSLTLGVDYYPEAWPREVWAADAAAMQAAGITMVRVAEFAWHVVQPSASADYNFTLFDDALGVLSARGIRAVVGTPTAAPPAWLVASDPDMQLTTAANTPVRFGSRQTMYHKNPLFVDATRSVVAAFASHFGADARVAAFQIDNEIHGEDDYGPATAGDFRTWLAAKYGGDIGALNEALGTVFWSHTYNSFDEVPPTWAVLGNTHNPGLALDNKRFTADVGASYLELQASILRSLAPAKELTRQSSETCPATARARTPNSPSPQTATETDNCMGAYPNVDYSRFGRSLDRVSFDNYPFSGLNPASYLEASEARIYGTALQAVLMRAAGAQRPFYVMEQQAANTGQAVYYGSGTVELYRLGAWQMVANGADGVQFFRWRTTRVGAEQHWEGVLNYDGSTSTARYRGVARLGGEFKRASAAVFAKPVPSRVALLYSVETRWAFVEQPLTPTPFDVIPQMAALLAAFRANRVSVDALFVPADEGHGPPALPASFNLSNYDIVLAPTLYVLPENVADAIAAFVASGGTLLATMRSGAKTSANAYVDTPLPGAFAPLAGVAMDEWDPMCSLGETGIRVAANSSLVFGIPQGSSSAAMSGFICEVLNVGESTEVLATYAGGYHDGRAVVTRKGKVYYFGAVSSDSTMYEWLAGLLAESAGLAFGPRLPFGVELSARGATTLAINWNGNNCTVIVPAAAGGTEVLSGRTIDAAGTIALAPYDVAVVEAAAAGDLLR